MNGRIEETQTGIDARAEAERTMAFVRVDPSGMRSERPRPIVAEMPVAIEVNGLGYAVLMATPVELTDLVTGFLLSERLIETLGDIVDMEELAVASGVLSRITLVPERAARVMERVRHRVSDSSCGLCGIENLEQALRPLPPLPAAPPVEAAAIFRALDAIGPLQVLNRRTGAAHAAAFCDGHGAVRLLREDVGRHNAFDKLIGAAMRAGLGWNGGFALLTSRCSYELVEKAVLAGCPTLVTISAPTSLAVERAREAGLTLRTLARADSFLEAGGPDPEARHG